MEINSFSGVRSEERGRVGTCQSDSQLNLTEREETEEREEMACVLVKMTTRSHFCPEFNVHNRPYSSSCVTKLGSQSTAAKDLSIQLGSGRDAEWR